MSVIDALKISNRWLAISILGLLGLVMGLGFYTFVYARGYSYLSDNPKACVNCHVMQPIYDRWSHSSHRSVAKCNDCHAPHSLLGKYSVKAINGLKHGYAFTTGDFHEPIMIKDFNRKVVLENCNYCHGALTSVIEHDQKKLDCLRCHAGVGHGF
jgi:cytochrome c nitrite reductase small subunit